MTPAAIIALVQGIASGIPKIIEAVKAGRDIGSIKIDEYISADALQVIRAANERADDFIKNG
jgi:hypothetical protein